MSSSLTSTRPKQVSGKRSTIDNIALVTQLAKDTVEEGRSATLLKVDLEKRMSTRNGLVHISATGEQRWSPQRVLRHGGRSAPRHSALPSLQRSHGNLAKTLECVDGRVCMYADDLAILCIGNNTDEAALSAQKAIEVLERELPPMGLRISTDDDKTNLLAFTTKKDPNNVRDKQFAVHYSNGDRVPTTRLTQYLGILIDDECNMIQHVESDMTYVLRERSGDTHCSRRTEPSLRPSTTAQPD